MKEILQENSDAVRQAGEALVEIGTELAAGRIENALGRLEAAHSLSADRQPAYGNSRGHIVRGLTMCCA